MNRTDRLADHAMRFDDVGQPVDLGQDASELGRVLDFQGGVDECDVVLLAGDGFHGNHVDVLVGNQRGHIAHEAGAIVGADLNLDREGGFRFGGPGDIHQAIVLSPAHNVADVGTIGAVDGDAAASGDIADNGVAGNRV